ncbi:D-glutamate cyclase family protein [Streptomyces sp. NPDC056524]|uniref:D-glutamate cyclase family protein n=1 Tax=Streptomyces sp. NPDC056524 TaxID=3345851 RepID=UPI0036AE6FC7
MTTTAVPDPRTARARAARGVTPQAAVTASRPAFVITHSPGRMLVTDVRDSAYRVAA